MVTDRESFPKFVEALRKDRERSDKEESIKPSSPFGPTSRGWQYGGIDSFLEAAIGWTEDTVHI